jgi:glycosyltransferase involved in cell wall biosynthesis
MDQEAFAEDIVPRFAERHTAVGFDVVEGPEYKAEAQRIREAFPEVPLVVKLHTASCVLQEVNINRHLTWWDKCRFLLGGLARGRMPSPYWTYDPSTDPEREHAMEADVVAAPSKSIGRLMADWWDLDNEKIDSFPYPFEARNSFLRIPPETDTGRITFIGRLEMRKGVLDLMRAVPRVLDHHPEAQFRFIGRALNHPKTGENLRALMERNLTDYQESVEFTGPVPYEQIPSYLEQTDICAFPSLYESFGLVCTEAMSAARGIVASSAGGMSEMLDGGACGRVVPPERPRALADAVLDLLAHPEKRKQLGRAARKRVQREYSFEAVAPQQEACYEHAISRHQSPQTA